MRSLLLSVAGMLLSAAMAIAADHRVEPLKEGPPADALAKEIAAGLSPIGMKVIRGTSRTVCEIWVNRQWPVADGFKPAGEALYPLSPGQLIGVVRYTNKGSDFRDQDIAKGVYTLRYARQPVDGDHVGTSPTIDFLLLVRAADDKSAKPMPYKELTKLSIAASGGSHPALLSMQKVTGEADKLPSIRHNDEKDWWIVRFASGAKAGEQTRRLPVDLVISGVAAE